MSPTNARMVYLYVSERLAWPAGGFHDDHVNTVTLVALLVRNCPPITSGQLFLSDIKFPDRVRSTQRAIPNIAPFIMMI